MHSGWKCGSEPSNFQDVCLVNVSVKYFSKICFGTIKIQPELKFFNSTDFGFSFIFTGSKIARISEFHGTIMLSSFPGMGFPVRTKGTGNTEHMFSQWGLVGTGNREQGISKESREARRPAGPPEAKFCGVSRKFFF